MQCSWNQESHAFRHGECQPLYKGDVPESDALASANSSSAQRGMIIVDSVIPELVKICHKEFGV